MSQLPKTPTDPDEKVPPTPPAVMAILILVLIGLMIATGRAALYPPMPPTWKTIHETPAMPMAEVNRILSESGAIIDSVKAKPDGSIETWNLKHRTGTWKITVDLKKTPEGVVYSSETVRCDISNLPSFTRTWEYPEPKAAK